MIGNKHTLYFHILQIFRKLSDIVKEAGRLNDNGFSLFSTTNTSSSIKSLVL